MLPNKPGNEKRQLTIEIPKKKSLKKKIRDAKRQTEHNKFIAQVDELYEEHLKEMADKQMELEYDSDIDDIEEIQTTFDRECAKILPKLATKEDLQQVDAMIQKTDQLTAAILEQQQVLSKLAKSMAVSALWFKNYYGALPPSIYLNYVQYCDELGVFPLDYFNC